MPLGHHVADFASHACQPPQILGSHGNAKIPPTTRAKCGVYGHQNALADVQEARRIWQGIRTWALS